MTDTKEIKFLWKKYKDLSNDELYAILHLRQKVFVIACNGGKDLLFPASASSSKIDLYNFSIPTNKIERAFS